MNLIADGENDQDQTSRHRRVVLWVCVISTSLGLFLVTFSPLLAGVAPYIVAGWPAACTGIWLRTADPWRERGAVGLYFHLAMAGFRSAAAGLTSIIITFLVAGFLKKEPDFNQLTVALFVLMCGCGISFVFGWIGAFLAFRNRVRVFVYSNLYHVCHGDFARITSLSPRIYLVNPANFVMAVAIVVPLLMCWFAIMVLTIPANGDMRNMWFPAVLLGSLPILGIACILMLIRLSNRIIAATPLECWGVSEPDPSDPMNWYQRVD